MPEPYKHLRWIVEVRTTGGGGASWWEPIAAFNVASVAEIYADDCSGNGLKNAYRVVERAEAQEPELTVVYET